MAAVQPVVSEHRLTLAEVIDWLVEDRMMDAAAGAQLKKDRRFYKGQQHPLVLVADQKLKSAVPPHKLLALEPLTEWLAKRVGMDYLHIDPLKIDFSAVTEVMSSAYATRFHVLPVGVSSKEVVIATAEPFLREWERELVKILKLEIRRVIANPQDIERYQVEFYNLAKSIKGANRAGNSASSLSNFEQLVEMGSANKQLDANDAHIVRIVDWLWQYAFEQRASDIHVEPRRDLGIVRFRIDGVLHQVYQIPAAVMNAMTSRIKILSRMDVVEKRRPQDGRIKTRTLDGQEIELRLSTLPTAFGEKLVMRIFDPEVLVRDFSELGFSAEDSRRWKEITERPNGIVLVTGPTGSGKTTTLYSTLKDLATPEVNVCTVEDPIEMVEPSFNQMQVTAAIDLGLRPGAARADAPGSGHHHGRRDPRPRDRRDGGAGGVDRAPRAVDAAHQRRADRDDAPDRAGRGAIPAQRVVERRHGAAPGEDPLHALQAAGRAEPRRGPGRVGCAGGAVQGAAPGQRLQGGRMPGMPQYRILRPHRRVRGDDLFDRECARWSPTGPTNRSCARSRSRKA